MLLLWQREDKSCRKLGGYKTEGYNVGSDKVDSDKTKTVLHQIVHDKEIWVAARKLQQPLTRFQNEITQSQRDFLSRATRR